MRKWKMQKIKEEKERVREKEKNEGESVESKGGEGGRVRG